MVNQSVMNLLLVTSWLVFGLLLTVRLFLSNPRRNISRRFTSVAALACIAVSHQVPAVASVSVRTSNSVDPWESDVLSSTILNDGTSGEIVHSTDIQISPATDERYIVRVGDNLWSIATAQTREDENILDFWKKIIKDNISTLKSGDPNLVFPGEEIMLPDNV